MTATYQAMWGIIILVAGICGWAVITYRWRDRPDDLADHRAAVRAVLYDQDEDRGTAA